MNQGIDKSMFELHMRNMQESMSRVNDSITKLFERQDEMNVVLTKNTVIMEEHHRKSGLIEIEQADLRALIATANTDAAKMEKSIESIEKDLKPIKTHVASVSNTMAFLSGIPMSIRVVGSIVIAVTSIIGCYFTYIQTVASFAK